MKVSTPELGGFKASTRWGHEIGLKLEAEVEGGGARDRVFQPTKLPTIEHFSGVGGLGALQEAMLE
eukprot:1342527-Pyramimonas_sp.AAC.1